MARPGPLFDRDQSQWPMAYAMKLPQGATIPPRWWRLSYYRGPQGQPVEVLYSKTKTQSEEIARLFAHEPVLGFDMEWPMDADKRPRLQDKVALIQLASERRVALFHIALHTGNTANDLIAPTLKVIIESPAIIKAGVAIMSADFSRLRTHFHLDPKGAFELSHLHNLVTTPQKATTRLCALSKQVEQHLGLPLWKGNVRTSDWSRPLTPEQSQYAAADAYVGFMLFHRLNAKRLAMDLIPPLPRLSDSYLPFAKAGIVSIQLESIAADGEVRVITAEEFFRIERCTDQTGKITRRLDGNRTGITDSETNLADVYVEGYFANEKLKEATKLHQNPKRSSVSKQRTSEADRGRPNTNSSVSWTEAQSGNSDAQTSMSVSSEALFRQLSSHRLEVAKSKGLSACAVAHNTVLQGLALRRPSNEEALLCVPGIGKIKVEQYGKSWLEIIAKFEAEQKRMGVSPGNGNTQISMDGSSKALYGKPEPERSRSNTKDPVPRMDTQPGHSSTQTSMDSVSEMLYGQLVSHRKKLAESKGIAAFVIAHNTVLRSLALSRPLNEEELLLVPGIGKAKAEQYGKSWLEIIAHFVADQQPRNNSHDDQYTPSRSTAQEPTNKGIVRLGRSKEILFPSDKLPAGLSTGLSFQFSEVNLSSSAVPPTQSEKLDNSDSEDLTFGPPIELPSPSSLKRKRTTNRSDEQELYQRVMQRRAHVSEGLSPVQRKAPMALSVSNTKPESSPAPPSSPSGAGSASSSTAPKVVDRERMILRKKIEAYIKSVTWATHPKPSGPLASENTMHYLTIMLPRTNEEFRRAPNIQPLLQACKAADMDMWRAFEKWTQGPAFARLRTQTRMET